MVLGWISNPSTVSLACGADDEEACNCEHRVVLFYSGSYRVRTSGADYRGGGGDSRQGARGSAARRLAGAQSRVDRGETSQRVVAVGQGQEDQGPLGAGEVQECAGDRPERQ